MQLALDGANFGPPIDLFNNGVIATGELDLGTHELAAGEHRLSVEIPGANEQAVKSDMFGLDDVNLVPANRRRGSRVSVNGHRPASALYREGISLRVGAW